MTTASAAPAVWRWPIVVAVLSALGLIGGLWGDGLWDWLAWLGLGLPVVLAIGFGLANRGARR